MTSERALLLSYGLARFQRLIPRRLDKAVTELSRCIPPLDELERAGTGVIETKTFVFVGVWGLVSLSGRSGKN